MKFNKFKIVFEDDQEILYLYVKTNFDNEFAADFDHKISDEEVCMSANKFIKKKKIPFHGRVIKIFAGTLLLGTFVAGCKVNTTNNISHGSDLVANSALTSETISSSDQVAEITAPERVAIAIENLTLTADLENIITDFTLPITGLEETAISWQSTNPGIEIDGANAIVTRGESDLTGNLIATVSYQDYSETKEFATTVLMTPPPVWIDDDQHSDNLLFSLNSTTQTYSVDYIGNYNHPGDLIIPSVHQGLPVTAVNYIECSVNGIVRIGANINDFSNLEFIIAKGVEISAYNSTYRIENNAIYAGNKLLRYFGTGGDYQVADGTTIIGSAAFENYNNFNDIIVPASVKIINERAFHMLTANSIVLTGVTDIDSSAFSFSKINEIKLSENLQVIGSYAFEETTGLTNLIIPDSVQRMGDGAFSFSQIKAVHLGAGLEDIGTGIFSYTTNIQLVTISVRNQHFSVKNNVLFNYDQTKLISYPSSGEASYTIPATVTVIGASAFAGDPSLTIVNFPSGLKTIETRAFSYSKLQDINLPASVETIGDEAFYRPSGIQFVTINSTSDERIINIGLNAFQKLSQFFFVDEETIADYRLDTNWNKYQSFFFLIE